MTDEKANDEKRVLEAPLAAWVRGGTTSLANDLEREREHAEAEARRDAEAARQRLVQANPQQARMYSNRLASRQLHPQVVLALKHPRENEIVDHIMCELYDQHGQGAGADEWVIQVACPYCVRNGIHMAQAQFKIHQTNRKFELDFRQLDQRKPNPLTGHYAGFLWVNPHPPHEHVTIAAMVNCAERCKCPGYGCTWAFRIDDSVIRNV